MKKHKQKFIWGGIIVLAVGLMIWGSSAQQTEAGNWADTDVACLAGGHQNALQHIHADLNVFIDGEEQPIPANTGISSDCMAEVHTHDSTGEIHVETARDQLDLTLEDFFAVWDRSFARDGYGRKVIVNGEEIDGSSYEFSDGDVIEVRFESSTSSATTTDNSTSTTNNPAS